MWSKTKNSASGPKYATSAMPGRHQVLLGLVRDEPGVARVRLAEHRIGHRADQRQRGPRVVRVDERGGGVRDQQHVRLVDLLEAADRGAVEAQPGLEVAGVQRPDRQRHVLPGPRQIDEFQIHHLDAAFGGELEHLGGAGRAGGHRRLFALCGGHGLLLISLDRREPIRVVTVVRRPPGSERPSVRGSAARGRRTRTGDRPETSWTRDRR